MPPLTILVWHVHGSWLGTFVEGPHRYLLAVRPGSTRGRKRPTWPASVIEVTPAEARLEAIDVVVFQNPHEMNEAREYLGSRTIGRDVAAVYVEHNAPEGRINEMQHPLANRADVTIVHVTHFNALFWDTGTTSVRIVEHGVADPGDLYSGELERSAVVINEAQRRARVTGTDLLPALERAAPVDLFGIGTEFDLSMQELHAAIARRRVYVHPFRWTSLGLALLEAMACGMPVVALATTEVPYAVPRDAGIVSNRLGDIVDGIRWLMSDAAAARNFGRSGRAHVLQHYGLKRFLREWDAVFALAQGGVLR